MYRYIAITFLFLLTSLIECSGQTHVQTATTYQTTTANSIYATFSTAGTAGNLVIVHIDWDGQTRSISSVKDNKGNSYARISGPTNWNGSSYRAELWYAYNIDGGTLKVTAKLSGAPTSFSQIYISEYSGIVTEDPLDQSAAASGSGTTVSSGYKTTTYNHELIFGASVGASGVLSTGSGFTNRSTANSNIIEDKKAAAVGSFNASFTSAGGNWVSQMATFITTSSLITLPIKLLSFTGQCNNDHIALDWTTASEMNNDYFTIERNDDGTNWNAIGTVKSAGNSSTTQKYSLTANKSNNEISYFRLKQTDIDGKTKYFNTIQVNNCHTDPVGISIYPNPTNGISLFGKIDLKANEVYSIVIYDTFGRMISSSTSNQPEFTVNFPHTLSSGVYYAKFSSAGFTRAVCFLVKH